MRTKRLPLILSVCLAAGAAHGAPEKWVIVTGSVCNLRSGPESSSEKIGALPRFTPLKIRGKEKNDYTPVETKAGEKGWAHASVLGTDDYACAAKRDLDLRFGPDPKEAVKLKYQPGQVDYPFRVLDRKGDFAEVVDFEKDTGWVACSSLSTKPSCVVKAKEAVGRAGPDAKYGVVIRPARGVVFEILKREGEWVQVKHVDGNTGWISRKSLWGAVGASEEAASAPEKTSTEKPAAAKPAKKAKAERAKKAAKSKPASSPAVLKHKSALKRSAESIGGSY